MKTSGKSWSRYIDKRIKAKKSGYRKSSETGEKYYEARPNHSDSDPKSKYAKGGIFEHGLEIGDKITGRNGLNKIEGYNKEMRETFTTDLDKGKRSSSRYAQGGNLNIDYYSVDIDDVDGEQDRDNQFKKLPQAKKFFDKVVAKGVTSEGVALDNVQLIKVLKNGNYEVVESKIFTEYAKGGKTKKGKKDPPIVRGFFDDEPYEYGSGGAIYVGDKVKIKSGYSQHDDKNAEVVRVMPDNKTLELKIKHKSGNEYVKFEKNEVEKFAKGGSVANLQIGGFRRNILGTLSFKLKLPSMRKEQDFSVYPVAEKTDYILIQSPTRFGMIQMNTGRGLMSQSHPNGAYSFHLQTDKKVQFDLTDSQLTQLKQELSKTAGSNVGSMGIVTDNQYADKFADGGMLGGFTYSIGGL